MSRFSALPSAISKTAVVMTVNTPRKSITFRPVIVHKYLLLLSIEISLLIEHFEWYISRFGVNCFYAGAQVRGDKGDMFPPEIPMLENILVVFVNTLSEWLLAHRSSASGGFAPKPPPGLCPWSPPGDSCPQSPVFSTPKQISVYAPDSRRAYG